MRRPYLLTVRQPGFHPDNLSSILNGVTMIKTYKGIEYIVFFNQREGSIMSNFNGYIHLPDDHPWVKHIQKKRWYDMELIMWKIKRSQAKRDKKLFTEPRPKLKRWYMTDYNSIPLDVHGGVTFGEKIVKRDVKKWPQGFTPGYWVGWDYLHAGDALYPEAGELISKDLQRVRDENPGMFTNHSDDHRWKEEEVEEEVLEAIDEVIVTTRNI